jgi:hypothetical protein
MILRRNEAQGRSDSELPPETTGLEYWRAWQPEIRIGADTYSLDIFVRATGKATCAMTYDLPSEIYEMIYMDDEDEAEVNVAAKYDLLRFVVGQASALRVPAFGLVRLGPNRVLSAQPLETFEKYINRHFDDQADAPYLWKLSGLVESHAREALAFADDPECLELYRAFGYVIYDLFWPSPLVA